MNVRGRLHRSRACPALVLVGLAACSDGGTEPVDLSLDAAAALTGVEAAEAVLGSNGWTTLQALSDRFAVVSAAPVGGNVMSMVTRIPFIAPELYGTTYVFDSQGGTYVPDVTRSDAPDAGIRFALYDVDPASEEPLADSEDGAADIVDVGSDLPLGFGLQVIAEKDGIVFAEYTVSADLSAGSAAANATSLDHDGLELDGALTDGSGTLDVDIVSGSVNDVAVDDITLDLVGGGFLFRAEMQLVPATGALSFGAAVQTSADFFLIVGSGTAAMQVVEVRHDDVLIATIEVTEGTLDATDVDERLSQSQISAIEAMVRFLDVARALRAELVRPLATILE